MTSPRLALNALEDELESCATFCREQGRIGIEVTAFAFPGGLDDDIDARVERHAAALAGMPVVSFHGPFLDLYPVSADPEISAVCQRRHTAAMAAAVTLDASYYVAHLNFLPLIRNTRYRDRFVKATADFWLPFADAAGEQDITIVLENLWETSPTLQKEVVERGQHPHLKASFDNGHALVFARKRAAQWIEVLGDDLAHCHLHDNDGAYDRHWAIGEGREDWQALFQALAAHAPTALLVLESDRLSVNQRSLSAARQYL